MLLFGDKNKRAAGIVGEYPAEKKEVEPDFDGAMSGFAADVLNAVKANDPGMLAKALSNYIQMCGKQEEYEEE